MKVTFNLLATVIPMTIVLCLTSCSQLRTVEAPYGTPNTGRAYSGLHYFLPRGIITIVGTMGTNGGDYAITIGRENEPDRHQRYRVVQGATIVHDDTSKFQVDANGLIDTFVDTTSTSKIADIVTDLTTTVINLGKMWTTTVGGAVKTGMVTNDKDDAKTPKPFKVSFDPFNKKDRDSAIKEVDFAGFKLEVEPDNDEKRGYTLGSEKADPRIHGHLSYQGIFYRPLTTVKLRIRSKVSTAMSVARNVAVPDPQSLAVYSFARGAFGDRKHKVTFAHGEPTAVDYTRPSELKGFTAIPAKVTADMLSALNAAPALGNFLWKPKADPNADIKSQTERLNAESTRLDAQKALLEKQAEVKTKTTEVDQLQNPTTATPKTGYYAPGTGLFVPQDPLGTSNVDDALKSINKKLDALGDEVAKLKGGALPPEIPPGGAAGPKPPQPEKPGQANPPQLPTK